MSEEKELKRDSTLEIVKHSIHSHWERLIEEAKVKGYNETIDSLKEMRDLCISRVEHDSADSKTLNMISDTIISEYHKSRGEING